VFLLFLDSIQQFPPLLKCVTHFVVADWLKH
jgi:hypothetical protein